VFLNNRIEYTGRHGIHLLGSDSNICYGRSNSFVGIGASAICDKGAFGSIWVNTHIAGSGIKLYQTRAGQQGAVCLGSDGKQYQVFPGQETAASTTDPVTNTGSTIWSPCFDAMAGTGLSTLPTWTSGLTWQGGPSVYAPNNAMFEHVYREHGFSPPYLSGATSLLMINPMEFTVGHVGRGMPSILTAVDGTIQCPGGFLTNGNSDPRNVSSYTWSVWLGRQNATDDSPRILSSLYSAYNSGNFSIKHDTTNKGISFGWDFHSNPPFELLTDITTLQFGRGATVGLCAWMEYGAVLGDTTYGRVVDYGNIGTSPNVRARAAGDFRFYYNPTNLYDPMGFRCTVTGSPGTWQTLYPCGAPVLAASTVVALPSAVTVGAGARGTVTDSNATLAAGLGNTVANGGANIVPVYSDGTNWKIG
jgi:hypothetical protein